MVASFTPKESNIQDKVAALLDFAFPANLGPKVAPIWAPRLPKVRPLYKGKRLIVVPNYLNAIWHFSAFSHLSKPSAPPLPPPTSEELPPIYVDELFPEAASMQVADDAKKAKETVASTSSSSTTLTDAWNNLSIHSKFRGVDERAEEFISKFREDMQLQREQSILEFQEMLARGS
ncbi:hypothetical protein RJ639_035489 [Escallonia herrerae]|uniref:Uncharacterized protein n=1 Tax=Escallonia herrerae TaxID=1293975 RepID=A0AA88WQM6_9ASTE|nr:hypothetical protein RJ639_035489 [Escallonia herrerae]